MDAATWDRRYGEHELVWTSQPNRFLVAETEDLPPSRALDLACGEGRNAVWLAERGWEVTGVDFSAVGIGTAQRLAADRGVYAQWIVADLLEYEPEPRASDLVIVLYLQVPAVERARVLRRAADAVGTAGTLLVVAHDSANLAEGYGGPRDPAVLYTAEDVVGDLAESGLQVARADRVRRPVETPEGVRTALDALVRATRA